MAHKNTSKGQPNDLAALREEWLDRLRTLTRTVKSWAEELDWSTRLISKKMNDSRLGPYEAPSLIMQKDTTRVLLDPVARFAPGADGVVDLYLMPAYDDIASLYYVDGEWRLHDMLSGDRSTAMGKEAEHRPFRKKALARFLDEMAAHAAESL